jgi:hypothetical protein
MDYGSTVGGAVAEEGGSGSGKFFDAFDVCTDEEGLLAGRKRDGDFDGGVFCVTFAAAETEAAFGDIVALDEFLGCGIEANAGGERDAGADVMAAIGNATIGKSRERSVE